MKIEQRFNKRTAALIDVQPPVFHTGPQYALGLRLTFYRLIGDHDSSTITMHLTPNEALALAAKLVADAQKAISHGVSYDGHEK